jgi:hypothetical protein
VARKAEPPKPVEWDIHKAAAKLRPLGEVEATDESDALKKGAEQFRLPATKLIATRRR